MIAKTTSWTVLVYGLLILILGLVGYYKSGSAASLYAGAGFGALLILSAAFMFCQFRFSLHAALILTLGLTITFGIRYFKTGKELPAILAVLSAAMLFFLLIRIARWK